MISFYRKLFAHTVLACFSILFTSSQNVIAQAKPGWKMLTVKSEPTKREDCGFAEVNGLFYLIGGRGVLAVDVFNPVTNTWTKKGPTPFEMHHFQAVVFKKEIYIVGGMTGNFPHEIPLDHIYIYNAKADSWRKGAEIPINRRRGSGGTIVFKNKIYLIGGIQDGHFDGTVAWTDVFDLASGKWETLGDAPHARDHFHAAVIGDKMYVSGGRKTSFKTKQVVDLTVAEIDVYDFKSKQWKTLPTNHNIPTQRAGSTSVAFKSNLLVLGGESNAHEKSHNEVEAFHTNQRKWSSLPALITGRHDTQALIYKNKLYIVAGSANRGGGPDQSSIEVLDLDKYFK